MILKYPPIFLIFLSVQIIEEFLKHEELPDKFNRLSLGIIGWSEKMKHRLYIGTLA